MHQEGFPAQLLTTFASFVEMQASLCWPLCSEDLPVGDPCPLEVRGEVLGISAQTRIFSLINPSTQNWSRIKWYPR